MRFELNWLSIVLIYWAVINIVTSSNSRTIAIRSSGENQ